MTGASRRKAIVRIALTVILLGGGIGAVSSLHTMDWTAFGAALAGVSVLPLALAVVVSTLQVFSQLARFAVLVPSAARQPLRELLEATAVGQLLNYATPLRAGDAYKLIRLAPDREPTKGRFSVLLAALLVERIADVVTLVVMGAWASFGELLAWLRSVVPSAGYGLAVAGGVTAAALLLAVLVRLLPRAFGSFFGNVWGVLWSPRFLRCLAIALATWSLDAGTLYWITRAVGPHALAFRDVMQSLFVLNLGIAVPVTVGNLGVFEATLGFALSRHGVPAADALAMATLTHVVGFSGLGLCVASLRLTRSIGGGAREERRPSPPAAP